MSVPLIINGVTFQYPQEFDKHWGPVLTNWSTAVTNGMLQTSGVNAATLIKSATTNPADAGFLRLAKTDSISWRNNLNNGNLALAINGSNQLTFNGTPIGATVSLTDSHIFVGNVSNQPADVAMSGDITITNAGVTAIGSGKVTNTMIQSAAGIAVNKLAALTASKIVVSDGSGFLTTVSSPSLTELGYLTGVTSAIQTQLNAITSTYLPLSGGTLSGTLNMGSNKIISLTQGVSNGEAVAFPVGTAQIAANAVTQSVSTSSGGISAGTSIGSISITTTGGPVVLVGNINLTALADGSGNFSIVVGINRNGTAVNGGAVQQFIRGQGAGGTVKYGTGVCATDTPAAGTYTYNLVYIMVLGSFSTADNLFIQAIELKK